MNKTVAFTLFGDNPKYIIGAEKNIAQLKEALPDWGIKIYMHDNRSEESTRENLRRLGAEIVDITDLVIGETPSSHFPFFWRFLEFFNDDICIVRDLDSRISNRELAYIQGWLDSGLDYFIIRDHPWHSPVPAGLLGMKNNGQRFREHFTNFVNTQSLEWGADQEILYQYFLPIDRSLVYYCGYDIQTHYMPRDDRNFFIGMQLDEFDNPLDPSGIQCLNFLNELNL